MRFLSQMLEQKKMFDVFRGIVRISVNKRARIAKMSHESVIVKIPNRDQIVYKS